MINPRPVRAQNNTPPDDATLDWERARYIRAAVRARSVEVRRRHPMLRHQSAIGAGILVFATAGVAGVAIAYAASGIPWWVALPAAALFMSLAHEIEHDTIHRLYFAGNALAQDVMLSVAWLLRPYYTLSPWSRRPLHLLHHESSGTERDIEEILITNGRRWGPVRALMTIDPVAGIALRLTARDRRSFVRNFIEAFRPVVADVRALPNRRRKATAILKLVFPLSVATSIVWYLFLVVSLLRVIDPSAVSGWPFTRLLTFLAVVWIGPNVLRVACLHGISSNMHYFGDIDEGNVVQQTQVLNRWWLLPAQLFCFDFGGTHSIHHFVPGDPFYIRHLTRRAAYPVMRANGVRFNDFGTFRRANRLGARGSQPASLPAGA